MQAIKAVYDGLTFTPKQPVPVRGHYEVVITFIEPIAPAHVCGKTEQVSNQDELNKRREMIKSLKGCMVGVKVDLAKIREEKIAKRGLIK